MRPPRASIAGMLLAALCLAGSATAQSDSAAAALIPDSAAAPQTAPVAPGPIVIAEPKAPQAAERFTGGNLVFVEGLFFYSKWKEEPEYYVFSPGYEPPTYEYSSRTLAAIASFNRVLPIGLSLGGSVGLLNVSAKRTQLGGSSYYTGGSYSSSASMNLIGPRIGYYALQVPGRITPYAAVEYDILSGSYGLSQNVLRAGLGALVRVAPTAAISIGVDYVDISEQDDATNILGLVGMNFILP